MKINIAAVTIIIGSHRAITATDSGRTKASKRKSKASKKNLFSTDTDVSGNIPVVYYSPDFDCVGCQRAILEFTPEGASRPLRLFVDTGSALTAVCSGRDIGRAKLIHPSYYACASYSGALGSAGWFGNVYESMVVFGDGATAPLVKTQFSLMNKESNRSSDPKYVFCNDGNATHPGIDGIIGVGLASTYLTRKSPIMADGTLGDCQADDNPVVLRAQFANNFLNTTIGKKGSTLGPGDFPEFTMGYFDIPASETEEPGLLTIGETATASLEPETPYVSIPMIPNMYYPSYLFADQRLTFSIDGVSGCSSDPVPWQGTFGGRISTANYAYFDNGTPALDVPQDVYDSIKKCGENHPDEMYDGSLAITIGSETPSLKIPMSLLAHENGTINANNIEPGATPALGLVVNWVYDSVFESKNSFLNVKFYEKSS